MNALGEAYDNLIQNYEEEYQLVNFIRRFLLTREQRDKLEEWDITVEDLLNGRIEGDFDGVKYNYFFEVWNAKLDRKAFSI